MRTMRRLLLAGLGALALALRGRRARLQYGVAAGEITPSAVLWTRSNEPGRVLEVWPFPRKGLPVARMELRAVAPRPRRAAARPRLPNRRYTYAFSVPFGAAAW